MSNAAAGFAAKLVPKFADPYTVTKVISPLVYEVTDEDGRSRVAYVNDVKMYH